MLLVAAQNGLKNMVSTSANATAELREGCGSAVAEAVMVCR